MQGILLVNKPKGISSFDVIRRLKAVLSESKVESLKSKVKIGHAGTLDPLARGLLIVLIGGATKQQGRFMKLDKTYEAEITLGAVSTTDDAEGAITPVESQSASWRTKVEKPSQTEIQAVLKGFVGEIQQQPPRFSAIKVSGQRAYMLARKGAEVSLPKRPVRIYHLKLLEYDFPKIKISAKVGSGTYIRSLARDVGQKLGTGAYLSGLVRTRVGDFDLKNAIDINSISRAQIKQKILPTSNKLDN